VVAVATARREERAEPGSDDDQARDANPAAPLAAARVIDHALLRTGRRGWGRRRSFGRGQGGSHWRYYD
jgi:hypothetical protein